MQGVGRRLLQTIRMERDAFVWMDFNDRATGDAFFILVAARLLLFLGLIGFGGLSNLFGLAVTIQLFLEFMIAGIIFWLLYSGLVWAILRFLLNKRTNFALLMRMVGFAYPTVLLVIAIVQFSPAGLFAASVATIIGSLWFLAVIARGLEYAADIPVIQGLLVGIGGYVGYVIVSAILSGLPF